MKKLSFFILFQFIFGLIYCSDSKIILNANYSRGFYFTGYEKVANLQGYSNSIVLDLAFQNNKTESDFKGYDQYFHTPKKSLLIGVTNFPSLDDKLGVVYSIIPSFQTNWGGEKFSAFIKLGNGLGFCTKPFNQETNRKNKALGSPINIAIYSEFGLEAKLFRNVFLKGGINFIHFSSASFKLPNSGVNIPGFNVGLSYSLHKSLKNSMELKLDSFKRISLSYLFGYKKSGIFGEKGFFMQGLSFQYYCSLKPKIYSYGLGADFYFDPSLPYYTFDRYDPNPSLRKIQFGLNGFFRIQYKRISAIGVAGYYLYNPTDASYGKLYQKIGPRVEFTKKIHGAILVKAKNFSADFLEFHIGLSF